LHVDALVAWFIDLAASHMKLRRFGRRHKSDPDDCATAANSREQAQKASRGCRRKLDKQKDQAVVRSACGVAARVPAMTALGRAADGG
jgi:hypothetical protein